jgi:hypothetical protein
MLASLGIGIEAATASANKINQTCRILHIGSECCLVELQFGTLCRRVSSSSFLSRHCRDYYERLVGGMMCTAWMS